MEARTPIALITGGSRGLGRSMALHCAARGSDIVLTYRSNRTEADAVVARIRELGRRAAALPFDAGDSRRFDAFVRDLRETLVRDFGRDDFDHLVNNAGVAGHADIAQTTEAQFDELANVHFKGVFFLTQKLLPLIADGGRIVNVSSGLARFSLPGYAAYASMKGAVEVFTRYLAKELGPRGITANVVAPGAIATDFGGGRVRDDAQLNAAIASQTALGRVGEADDIGGAVASLLAPENRWINAQRIEVSGGMFV